MRLGRLPRLALLLLALLVGLVGFVPAADAAKVHPKASVRTDHKTITLGKSVVLSGSVTPNLHGKRVTVQQKSGRTWKAVKRVTLNSTSSYSVRVRPGSTGTKRYRVSVGKKNYSRVITVKVKAKAKKRSGGSSSNSCTPGYSPCIPPASDVDCAGGSGNGPAYVEGPVYVSGDDPYGLDADGDGVACE